MKTAELTGELLDYWVARAEGWTFGPQHKTLECDVWRDADGCIVGMIPAQAFQPSVNWSNGGPILQREMDNVRLNRFDSRPQYAWIASHAGSGGLEHRGASPLEAAMRAYVASKFGDEVPDDAAMSAQQGQGGGDAN